MDVDVYRLESQHQILGPLLAQAGLVPVLLKGRSLAVSLAAKCCTMPLGQEIRVVHVNTGEVVFRKTVTRQSPWTDN